VTSTKVIYKIKKISYETVLEEGHTLLDGALIAKIDPPFSCLEGVCGTCEARIESGEVRDVLGSAAEGYPDRVKTCQTFPKSSLVIVDYDSK